MYHSDAGAGPAAIQPALKAGALRGVARPVVWIGLVSLLTDVSAEMITSILPLYLFMVLRLSPLEVGWIDGLLNGMAAMARVWFAHWADHRQQLKSVAFAGYALSALSRVGLFVAGLGGWISVAAVLLLDRLGKGIRTAPRDAMIARWSTAAKLGAAFGVHRAMDAVGALTGPLIASALLFAWPERFDLVFAVSLGFACAGLLVLGRRVPRPPPPALDAAAAGDPDTAGTTATDAGSAAAWSSLRDSLRRLARAPTAALCAGSALLALFTVSDGLVYAGLQARGVLSAASMPLMFVATAAVFMALAWPLGRLADRHGPLRVFAAGHVALVALYALLASGGSWPWTVPQAGLVVLTVALMGVYYAATDGVVMALAARGLPADLQTTGMALVASAIGLARLGSSVLFGWCWTTWSQDVALSVFAAGLGAALAVALLAMKRWTAHRSGTAKWAT
jgi:MFS family permease